MRNQAWSVADIIPAKTPKQETKTKTGSSVTKISRVEHEPPTDNEWRKAIKKGCLHVLDLIENGRLKQAKKILQSQDDFIPIGRQAYESHSTSVKKLDPLPSSSPPWNKGQVIGQKPPLQARHVWAIRQKLEDRGAKRDLALFNIAIDSKLLGHEVVQLKVKDVAAPTGKVATQATWARENKKPVRFEIGEESQRAIMDYLRYKKRKPDDFLFGGRGGNALTGRQFARLVSQWVTEIGLDNHLYGTHSLRRTKAMLIYQQTGNLRTVQTLLGHKKAETTVAYLGIGECEDALEAAGQSGI